MHDASPPVELAAVPTQCLSIGRTQGAYANVAYGCSSVLQRAYICNKLAYVLRCQHCFLNQTKPLMGLRPVTFAYTRLCHTRLNYYWGYVRIRRRVCKHQYL